ncbi:MAG TPA: hypothetical protein VE621_18065 [Bryobacteraceae bacterium]|jgi:hypothetical protein|nr:hypothetical protein [Bryobacteraceae bacterium]
MGYVVHHIADYICKSGIDGRIKSDQASRFASTKCPDVDWYFVWWGFVQDKKVKVVDGYFLELTAGCD